MTLSSQSQSAIIYDFAARARARAEARGQTAKPASHASQSLPTVDFGSGWYHEAAIQEAERSGKP